MNAVKIKDNVYWVGSIDWNLRNFHGYITQKGSSYNAYLIIDEKITLIDTVKHHTKQQLIERVKSIIDPKKINYIIVNHVEMDHSGALSYIKNIAPNAQIITSIQGKKGLIKHFGDLNYKTVENGEILNTGKYTLQFFLTPMVHWPDNMVTYLQNENILFSNDAFGQHIASTEHFVKDYGIEDALLEAKKYYANIVMPYGAQVKKALNALSSLKIDFLAPSHGLIWSDNNIELILNEYKKWCNNDYNKKVSIVYDTMWGSTEIIANTIMDTFEQMGYSVKLFHLQYNHISDIITDILDSQYICVGSPTLNNNMLPTVSAFLTYLIGLSPKRRKSIAFGSYGWGGQSISQIESILNKAGIENVYKTKFQYIPDNTYLGNLKNELKGVVENG